MQAFRSAVQLLEARKAYEVFSIPIIVIPATLSNNVPGTDYSLGTDTSLNVIVEVRNYCTSLPLVIEILCAYENSVIY